MFKLLYLPEAVYVVDGGCSYRKLRDLSFKTEEEALSFFRDIYFAHNTLYPDVSIYSTTVDNVPIYRDNITRIPKHLVEIVEVP